MGIYIIFIGMDIYGYCHIKAEGAIYENNGITIGPEDLPALEETAGKRIQEIATDWRERFQEANIEVEVEAKIRNTGTTSKKLDIPQ